MYWQGKIIGALVGLLVGPVGAAVGVALGHSYDLAEEQRERARGSGGAAAIGDALFATAFAVMGHLAKADGRVSEAEIEAARAVMRQMQLSPAQVAAAIDCYTRGKRPDYPLGTELTRLKTLCGPRHDLLRMFLELEVQAALAGNGLVPPVRQRLLAMAQLLGFGGLEMAAIEASARLQAQSRHPAEEPLAARLAAAHQVLGVAAGASDEDVKKAYRRQMNQNHPDKLMARGLPESMQELAKEKTQRIREAYDLIAAQRGLR